MHREVQVSREAGRRERPTTTGAALAHPCAPRHSYLLYIIHAIKDPGNTLRFKYDDQGMRTQKRGQHGETVYVNQWYTVRNGAITSKHIFAGTSRIATRVITAEQAPRERELDGSESLGGLTVETTSSVMGTSSPDTETSSAQTGKSTLGKAANDSTFADSGHPGKGLANRSERANEVAQNTAKNPHLSGSHPGQGLENRSDRANERAQNTNKNPHLIGGGDGGDGGTPPDTGTPGGGSGGGNGGGGSAGAGADFLYYYHPDHLGSTGYVTDDQGQLYEHVLYFPFGETWVEQASNTWRTPYLYTSKELDPETGLYYFGARYYDPRTSVWQSADPILGQYLDGERGMGGVFNPFNLDLYAYTHLNPMRFTDPDGNATWVDEDGYVQVATNDDDTSIYMINEGGDLSTVGQTWFPDAFISPDTGNSVGRVYLGQSMDDEFYSLALDAMDMSANDVAINSTPGKKFDLKANYPGHEGKSYHGFLLDGKYMTTREAGNVLAGFNAATHGIRFDDFQKRAGALHAGGIAGLLAHETFGTTFGSSPNWGEIDYQRTRSEFGYQMYLGK